MHVTTSEKVHEFEHRKFQILGDVIFHEAEGYVKRENLNFS